MGTAPDLAVRDWGAQSAAPVRVFVVDDSPTVRAVFMRLINSESDLELAASADCAEDAIEALSHTTADVILLDLDMPGMGGLGAIPRLLEVASPARILVVSSLTVRGAEHTLAALSLGAADTLAKPRPGEFHGEYRETLLRKIRLLGRVAKRARARHVPPVPPALLPRMEARPQAVAIGASTGGIHALGQLLNALPDAVDLPIFITQHLPVSFMEPFVRQLRAASRRHASVAVDGSLVVPGQILVAPGDAHLTIAPNKEGRFVVQLETGPVASGCRPSVDPMFASMARIYGNHALGVVLSGMGRDGAEGAARIVAAGGAVLAQDAASSAVWGMPGAVATAGLASALLPPEAIAVRIAEAVADA